MHIHLAGLTKQNLQMRLTPREELILKYISIGLTSKQIANQLNLSDLTIKTHRRNMLKKAGVKNIASLMSLALSNPKYS